MTTDLPPQARISAAIEKLERLKAESDAGPWKPGLMGHVANEQGTFADLMAWPTADLIVTLHRTIDPVLAILRGAEEAERESGYFTTASFAGIQALALADSILGGKS